MSLSRSEIYTLVQQLKGLENARLQAFWELEPRQWALALEKDLKRHYLLLCFKSPFLRFHLLSHAPKGHETPFTQKWMSFLHGAILEGIEMAGNDRILKLHFQHVNKHYYLVGEFFPKRPNLYLLDHRMHILQALNPVEETQYIIPDNPRYTEILQIDPSITHKSIESLYSEKEKELRFQKNKSMAQAEISQRLKRSLKTLQKVKAELDRCRQWQEVQHEAKLLQANIYKLQKGMAEVIVSDWEKDGDERTVALDPSLEPKDDIALRFRQSKKQRAGIEHQARHLEKTESEILRLQSDLEKLKDIESLEDLHQFCQKARIKLEKPEAQPKEKPALPYHEFMTEAGLKIWVGKNAQANEKLTFSCARGSDWWLHAADCPGSHVVLRVEKNREPDPESIQDAIQLALAYSKAKDQGDADVFLTQCKYVSRFGKGQPGKVQISKHKKVHAKFNPGRYQKIKERLK